MRGTTPRLLISVVVVAAIVSFALFRAWLAVNGQLPEVPVSAPVVLGFVALVFVVAAGVLTPRLHASRTYSERTANGPKPLHPLAAARVAVMSVAAGLVGALVVGGYLGFALAVLSDLDSDFRRQQLVLAALSAVAAAILVVAAHLLERACRIPDDHDHADDGSDRSIS